MDRWEYLYVYAAGQAWSTEPPVPGVQLPKLSDTGGMLNTLGAIGWELAAVETGVFYFKRRLSE